jgi:hypothetical protein
MGRAIKAGRVWTNCYHHYPAHAAFGGYKESGVGRENHKMMLPTISRPRTCWFLLRAETRLLLKPVPAVSCCRSDKACSRHLSLPHLTPMPMVRKLHHGNLPFIGFTMDAAPGSSGPGPYALPYQQTQTWNVQALALGVSGLMAAAPLLQGDVRMTLPPDHAKLPWCALWQAADHRRNAGPRPADDQILVKIAASGVCHTDLHAAEGDWPVKPHPPFIPGHEGVGHVAAVGKNVKHVKEGDRVGVPWLHSACGFCRHCIGGWETLCESQTNTGYSVNGGFADYALADPNYVGHLPSNVSFIESRPCCAPASRCTRA